MLSSPSEERQHALTTLLSARWWTGTYKEAAGNASCLPCPAGKYAAAAGSTVCTSCEAGKYKATAGVNIACDQCEGGKFSAAAGATACDIYMMGAKDKSCNDFCLSLGRSCNLEATRNLNTEQLVRGVLGQLGLSIFAPVESGTEMCSDSGSGWDGHIPFYYDGTNTYYFCPGAGSLKSICAGGHLERQRICACGGTNSALDQYPAHT